MINEHYQQEQCGQSTTNKSEGVVIKQQTNADRIRAMTDEEMAQYLYVITCEDGYPAHDTIPDWLDWLKQEAR